MQCQTLTNALIYLKSPP